MTSVCFPTARTGSRGPWGKGIPRSELLDLTTVRKSRLGCCLAFGPSHAKVCFPFPDIPVWGKSLSQGFSVGSDLWSLLRDVPEQLCGCRVGLLETALTRAHGAGIRAGQAG